MKYLCCLLALLAWLRIVPEAHGQVEPNTPEAPPSFDRDTWHLSVSPYLWFAGLDGTLTLDGHAVGVHQSFADIFSNLKFGVM